MLNYAALRAAEHKKTPYDYVVGANFIAPEYIAPLSTEFPAIDIPGFHPAAEMDLKPRFREFIQELEGPELTQALSEKFGIDFSPFPRLITIRRISAAHEGRIHCDSKSKVMSLLIYMNDNWEDGGAGRLRVLRSERDFDDYAEEISPEMGSVFAFLRADHSWHGHKPFVGERRVIQIAWLRDQSEIERKKKRHRFSSFFKHILPAKPSEAY